MSATDSLETEIRAHLLRSGSWTKPAALWWALFTTIPNEAGLGGVEPSGGAYARISYGPGDLYFDATGQNISAVTWSRPTTDWGWILGVGAWTQASGGVLKLVEAIDSPYYVRAGEEPPVFLPTKLKILFE